MFSIYQLKIDKRKNAATLELSGFFYPPQVLECAAKEFRKACSVRANPKGGRVLLQLAVSNGFDAEQTMLAFLNFALALRREI